MMQPRVFSGIQPTGNLHLGNYLGAIKNWLKLQNDHECIYTLVDLHAITVFQDPATLRDSTYEMYATLLATGIDVNKHTLFVQSHVREHTELAWILSCVARTGWLNRMIQFKEKAGKNKEKASVGLYTYPVLQTADILLYNADKVPVGEDQKQHIELARDIAIRFNQEYGSDFFTVPDVLIKEVSARVMSLRDGSKKMSKSDPSDLSRINIIDDADTIANKLRKAKTDSDELNNNLEQLKQRPEAYNLISMHADLLDQSLEQSIDYFSGKNFSFLKSELSDVLIEKIVPIGTEVNQYLQDKSELDKIMKNGAQKASAIASKNIVKVKEIVGFVS